MIAGRSNDEAGSQAHSSLRYAGWGGLGRGRLRGRLRPLPFLGRVSRRRLCGPRSCSGRAARKREVLIGNPTGSDEYFASRAGQDNGKFVQAIYYDILGRQADPNGYLSWTAQLNNGTMTRVHRHRQEFGILQQLRDRHLPALFAPVPLFYRN